jgi:hypothetical protein
VSSLTMALAAWRGSSLLGRALSAAQLRSGVAVVSRMCRQAAGVAAADCVAAAAAAAAAACLRESGVPHIALAFVRLAHSRGWPSCRMWRGRHAALVQMPPLQAAAATARAVAAWAPPALPPPAAAPPQPPPSPRQRTLQRQRQRAQQHPPGPRTLASKRWRACPCPLGWSPLQS